MTNLQALNIHHQSSNCTTNGEKKKKRHKVCWVNTHLSLWCWWWEPCRSVSAPFSARAATGRCARTVYWPPCPTWARSVCPGSLSPVSCTRVFDPATRKQVGHKAQITTKLVQLGQKSIPHSILNLPCPDIPFPLGAQHILPFPPPKGMAFTQLHTLHSDYNKGAQPQQVGSTRECKQSRRITTRMCSPVMNMNLHRNSETTVSQL